MLHLSRAPVLQKPPLEVISESHHSIPSDISLATVSLHTLASFSTST